MTHVARLPKPLKTTVFINSVVSN